MVIGRVIQGTASGALLPVTLALAADLWAARNRAAVLGGIGAAQELGSVLGPLWGIAVVSLLSTWRDVFWINIPFTIIAMVMIHFSVPSHDRGSGPRERVDVVGGVLLAIALGLAVIGLYNPAPDGKQVLPSWGLPVVGGAIVAALVFFGWERYSRTKLIDPAGVRFRPFLAALGTSVCAGAALMVTLVNVELFGQGVLGLDQVGAALKLTWFLAALPIGALVGGAIATRIGDRAVVFAGMLIAGFAYWQVSHWRVDVLSAHHDLGVVSLPAFPTDLFAGGPRPRPGDRAADLGGAARRPVGAARHRVVARRRGADDRHARRCRRAVGVGPLPLQPMLATLPSEGGDTLAGKIAARGRPVQAGVLHAVRRDVRHHRDHLRGRCAGRPADRGRHTHADDPAEPATPAADDSATQVLSVPGTDNPTQRIATKRAPTPKTTVRMRRKR